MINKIPIGVSEWRKYGKEYKYYDYFEQRIRKDERKKVLKKINDIMSTYAFDGEYLNKFNKLLRELD